MATLEWTFGSSTSQVILEPQAYQFPGKLVLSLPAAYNIIGCNVLSVCSLKITVINFPNMRHEPATLTYSLTLFVLTQKKEAKRVTFVDIPAPSVAKLVSSQVEQSPQNLAAEKVSLRFQMTVSVTIPSNGSLQILADTSLVSVPDFASSTFELVQAPDGSFSSGQASVSLTCNFAPLVSTIIVYPNRIEFSLKDPLPANVTLDILVSGLSAFKGLTVVTDGKYALSSAYTMAAYSESTRKIIEDEFPPLIFLPPTDTSLIYAQIAVTHVLTDTDEHELALFVQNTNKVLINGVLRVSLPPAYRAQNNTLAQINRIWVDFVGYSERSDQLESFEFTVMDDPVANRVHVDIHFKFEWFENEALRGEFGYF